MSSQKYENMLNLALETPEEERALSESLNVGYNVNEDTWQVIIRYNGSIEFLRDYGASIIVDGEVTVSGSWLLPFLSLYYVRKNFTASHTLSSQFLPPCLLILLGLPG